MLKVDGFDNCILGSVTINDEEVLAYDIAKMIQTLMSEGLTEEDAIDHFEFNIACAYVGEDTPIYIDTNWEEG